MAEDRKLSLLDGLTDAATRAVTGSVKTAVGAARDAIDNKSTIAQEAITNLIKGAPAKPAASIPTTGSAVDSMVREQKIGGMLAFAAAAAVIVAYFVKYRGQ